MKLICQTCGGACTAKPSGGYVCTSCGTVWRNAPVTKLPKRP